MRGGPVRDKASKWFVTAAEWPGAVYPAYCAGWAYVTSLATVRALLDWAGLASHSPPADGKNYWILSGVYKSDCEARLCSGLTTWR